MTATQIKALKPQGGAAGGAPQGAVQPPQPRWASPSLGLAKGTPVAPKAAEPEQDRTDEYTSDDAGRVTGTASSLTHSAQAGAQTSTEQERTRTDGRTTTTTGSGSETLAGAEASVKILRTSSRKEIEVAVETLARAGAFGARRQAASIQRGKAGASMAAEGEAGAGVQAKATAMARLDRSGVVPALEAVLEASIRAGVWVDGKVDAEAHIGPMAMAVCAEIEALLGAEAEVSARAFASLKEGVGGEFAASAFAGARFLAKAGAEIRLGPAALMVGGEVEGMAGASASVEAGFKIHLTGVSAKFEASAFAGAKAGAKGSAGLKLMGKKIIWAEGKVEVSAGAGVEAEGEFTIINGKLKLSAGLAGTLGLGVGAAAKAEVDFAALGEVICAKVGDLSTDGPAVSDQSPDFERRELTGAAATKQKAKGRDAVYEDFLAYAHKLSLDGKHGVKQERVQAIIESVAPLLRADFAYRETDQGIEEAAMEAFAGQLRSIVVNAGKIRGFQPESEDAITAHKARMVEEEGWKKARDAIKADFDAYAAKKANGGKNGVKRASVQEIVDKHWKALQSAFPGAEADQVVMFAAEEMKADFLDEFTVAGGKVKTFVVSAAKTAGVKQAAATLKAESGKDAARAKAFGDLDTRLAAYHAQLLTAKDAHATLPEIRKIVGKAIGSVPANARGSELDNGVASRIRSGLPGIVSSVQVKDGVVGPLSLNLLGVSDAKGQQGLVRFARELESYKEQKTAGGKEGAKREKVEELLATSFKVAQPWLKTSEGSTAAEGTIRAKLGDWVTSVMVVEGRLVNLQLDAAKMAADKVVRKRDGKSRLGGAEEDNTRRKMVADGVRSGFSGYIGELRAAGEKNPASPKAVVQAAQLQKLIDQGVKGIRGDVNNEVGDQALEDGIRQRFPMVTDVRVQGLRVTALKSNTAFFSAAAARNAESAEVRRALDDVVTTLGAAKGTVTPKLVQMVIDRNASAFGALPADERDSIIAVALGKALGDRAQGFQVVGGKVTSR